MRRALVALLGLVPAALLLAPRTAAAFERQWHVGASLGYAGLIDPALNGFGGGIHVARGLTDSFNLVAEADVTYHPSAKILIPSGAVGGTFVFDVLLVVPYVGALVGAADQLVVGGPGAARLNLVVPFGADYVVSRSFSIGLAGRLQVFLANGPASASIGPFVRAEYTWGY